MPRLAFLGPRATFTEQALQTLPESRDAELVPCAGTSAVLAAVRAGSVDAGCVPIENSIEGAVAAVLDELVADPPLVIIREILLPVRFAVLIRPGTDISQIRSVASHPHGEAQTRGWLARHLPHADVVLSTSTAEAAAQVGRGEVDAAVAAPIAAREHGLAVLADDVADTPDAVTRFGLLAPPRPPQPPTGHDRTSLVATTENRPGALLGVLTELAVRGVDLSRIESRPIKHRRGEYWFHLDCAGHVAEPAMGEALAALHRRCTRVRYLGSYPKAPAPPTSPPATSSPAPGTDAPDRPAEPVNGSGAARFTAAADWLALVRAGRSA